MNVLILMSVLKDPALVLMDDVSTQREAISVSVSQVMKHLLMEQSAQITGGVFATREL